MTTITLRRLGGVFLLAAAITSCSSSNSGGPNGSSDATTTVASSSTIAGGSTTAPSSSAPSTDLVTTVAPLRPGVVNITYAGSSAGAGELEVDWDAADYATGYRVYRATSTSGPWTIMATVDVLTGAVTTEPGVVNLYADHQTFLPLPYTSTGTSTKFFYVEYNVAGGPHVYFRVVAFNGDVRGHTGATVCAQITGQPPC